MRSIERSALALVAVSLVAVPFAHGVALVLRHVLRDAGAPAALGLTAAVTSGALAAAAVRARSSRTAPSVLACLAVGVAAALALVFAAAAPAAGVAALLVCPLTGWAVGRVADRMPSEFDGVLRTRPASAVLWGVMGICALIQTGRISTFLTDDTFAAGATIPGYFADHMCLPAYLQAAELNAAGAEDIYDPAHYPGLTRDATRTTSVPGMEPYLDDPFQYPPPFLLVGRLALAIGPDYDAIRTGWFVFQALAFAVAALLVGRWIGGAAGRRALLLFPLVWLAPATNFNLQYGQAHLLVIVTMVLGMLAVERGRNALGGALLAAAVLAKLFPGLLLLMLVVQRRWRALAWTVAMGVGIVGLSLAVLGTQPWIAFFENHLPRLADGTAFAFDKAWPELRTVLVSGNQSPLGLVEKLVELGFVGARDLAPALNIGYLVGIALVAGLAGLRRGSRVQRAATWLALLSLGSMQSGGAWAEYITVSVLWMLSFVAPTTSLSGAGRLACGGLVLTWGWFLFLPGSMPPIFWEGPGAIALSALGFLFAVALATKVALGPLMGTPRDAACDPPDAPRLVPADVRS